MNGYYKQLIAILKDNKIEYYGPGKGSHEIWIKGSNKVTIPRNCYSKHTANDILKDFGLPKQF